MADPRGIAFVLVILAILTFGGLAAADQQLVGSGVNTTDITNESFTPTGGEYNNFSRSEENYTEYSADVDVRDANLSDVQSSGNYTWNNETNGTLFVHNQSYLNNETQAFINYTITEANPTTVGMFAIVQNAVGRSEVLLLLVGVALVFGVIRVLGGSF